MNEFVREKKKRNANDQFFEQTNFKIMYLASVERAIASFGHYFIHYPRICFHICVQFSDLCFKFFSTSISHFIFALPLKEVAKSF